MSSLYQLLPLGFSFPLKKKSVIKLILSGGFSLLPRINAMARVIYSDWIILHRNGWIPFFTSLYFELFIALSEIASVPLSITRLSMFNFRREQLIVPSWLPSSFPPPVISFLFRRLATRDSGSSSYRTPSYRFLASRKIPNDRNFQPSNFKRRICVGNVPFLLLPTSSTVAYKVAELSKWYIISKLLPPSSEKRSPTYDP